MYPPGFSWPEEKKQQHMILMKRKNVLFIPHLREISSFAFKEIRKTNKYAVNACLNQVSVFRKKKSPCDDQGDLVERCYPGSELFSSSFFQALHKSADKFCCRRNARNEDQRHNHQAEILFYKRDVAEEIADEDKEIDP